MPNPCIAFAVLVVLTACRGPNLPQLPHGFETPSLTVLAERLEDAEVIARSLTHLLPTVCALLQVDEGRVTVLVTDLDMPELIVGHVSPGGVILLEPGKLDEYEPILAHELVHRFVHDSDVWSRLHGSVEEGLADVITGTVLPKWALATEFQNASCFPPTGSRSSGRVAIRAALSREAYEQDAKRALACRAVGFALARRIGIEGLRTMCEVARRREYDKIPVEWLLDACGVGEEEVGLWARVLGEAERDGWSSFSIESLIESCSPSTDVEPVVIPPSK